MTNAWSFQIMRQGGKKQSFRVSVKLAPPSPYLPKRKGIHRHTTPTTAHDRNRQEYLLRKETVVTVGAFITIDVRVVPPITPERAAEWVSRGHLEDSRRI